MKLTGALLCLVIGVAAVNGISIAGRTTFNTSGLFAGGSLNFPGMPGINVPFSQVFGSRTTLPSSASKPNSSSSSTASPQSNSTRNDSPVTNRTSELRIPNLLDMFNMPAASALISGLASNRVPSLPQIPGLSNLAAGSAMPGVDQALNEAREHVTQALSLGASFEVGIDQAIQNALANSDPSAALQTLVQTILDSYQTVAANCPLIVVGARVLQEGIRLAGEVARSAGNVVFGTTTSSTTPSSTTTSSTTTSSTTMSSTTVNSTTM